MLVLLFPTSRRDVKNRDGSSVKVTVTHVEENAGTVVGAADLKKIDVREIRNLQQDSRYTMEDNTIRAPSNLFRREDSLVHPRASAKRQNSTDSTNSSASPASKQKQQRLHSPPAIQPPQNNLTESQAPVGQQLAMAAKEGRLDDLKNLLQSSEVDINALVQAESGKAHRTLLGWASVSGHTDVVKFLIEEHEANPAVANADGETPLHCAAYFGHAETAKALIETGRVDVNATEKGWSALHYAAGKNGSLSIVKDLIQAGANIESALQNGMTALGLAAQNGHFGSVKFLVEAGGKTNTVTIFSGSRFTPLHMAANAGHLNIVQFLVENANVDPFGPLDLVPAEVTAQKAGKHNVANYLAGKYASSPTMQAAITKKDSMVREWTNYSTPTIKTANGQWVELDALAPNIMRALGKLFAQRPQEGQHAGVLTAMLQGLTAAQNQNPLDPKLTIALTGSGTLRQVDDDSDRRAVEAAIVAHWDGHLQFHPTAMDAKNKMVASEQQHEELATRMVNAYVSSGLIQPGDDVMDVGTGRGLVPKLLAQQGFNVEAIEPLLNACGRQVFDSTLEMTASQYLEQNPDKKFDVVHVGNFHPDDRVSNEDPMDATRALIRDVSDLTSNTGKALIGISSTDPYFVSTTSRFYLRPVLEACFERVIFKSPSELGEALSIGGQMGIFECTGPRRLPSANQERQ